MPQRFGLKYTGADNAEHCPVVIHRAIFGSFERFMALLVEHYAGAFPLWLAPVQATVLPLSDRHLDAAKAVAATLEAGGLRVTLDARVEKIGYKIREAQLQQIPYMLVLGDREAAEGTGLRSQPPGRGPRRPCRRGLPRRCPAGSAAEGEVVIAFDRGRPPRRDDRVRINDRIRVREVRVIDETGAQLGIMAPQDAIRIARSKGLDLVEVSATAVPPVCRITDYGRYQYNEQKRARQARKHQKTIEVKEIKFRPKVDEHDYDFKKKHIERFLAEGDKVKATVFFRGREIAHPEIGRRILERLIQEVSELAISENVPRLEGNTMHTILGPKPQLAQQRRERLAANAGSPATRGEHGVAERHGERSRSRHGSAGRRARRLAGDERGIANGRPTGTSGLVRARQGRRGTETDMPKLKSHRGAAKRFKRTASGKFLRAKAFKRHILTSKSTKRKRSLRKARPGVRRRSDEARSDAALQVRTARLRRARLASLPRENHA